MINLEIKPFETLHHSNYSSMIESITQSAETQSKTIQVTMANS